MIGGAYRVEGRQRGFVIVHFHVFAHQQVPAPSLQRNVVVVHHRYDVGLQIVGPEQAQYSALDAIPAYGFRQGWIVLLLLAGCDVDTPVETIVARRLLIADDYQIPVFHRLEPVNRLSRRVNGCRYYDFLHI